MENPSAGIEKLAYLIDTLRKEVIGDWQVQQIRIFLLIAQNHPDGITQTAIGEKLKFAQSVVSRNCRTLGLYGKVHEDGRKELIGHDLIHMAPDPFEARRLSCRLSKKGMGVYTKIVEITSDWK